MPLINQSLKMTTTLGAMAIKQLERLNGLSAQIYFPVEQPSLYTDSSQDYTYNSVSDEDGQFLFTGIYGLEPLTGLGLDFYTSFGGGDAKMYVVGDRIEIPRNSKVEVFYEGSLKVFRTQDTHVVNGLNGEPIYAIHQLVPVA